MFLFCIFDCNVHGIHVHVTCIYSKQNKPRYVTCFAIHCEVMLYAIGILEYARVHIACHMLVHLLIYMRSA